MATINLNDIFKDAFGYKVDTREPIIEANSIPLDYSTATGQPYYDEDVFGREHFLPIKLDGKLIPFAVMGMTWKKTIVSTPMPERGGSVNELVAIDDYLFNIKGILISPDNVFPEDEIIDLKKTWLKGSSVTLRSVLSDLILSGRSNIKGEDYLGHRVLIKEIKWPAVAGVEHAKPFEMELVSDLIFDIEID
jgi:hypothetical protein